MGLGGIKDHSSQQGTTFVLTWMWEKIWDSETVKGFGNESHYTVGEHGVANLGAQIGMGDAFECLDPSIEMPQRDDLKKP